MLDSIFIYSKKSAWIFGDNNKRILVSNFETKKDDTSAKINKAARSMAVKTMQEIKAKKISNASWHLGDNISPEAVSHFASACVLMNYQNSRKVDIFAPELTEEEKKEQSVIPALMDQLNIHSPLDFTQKQVADAEFRINSAHCALYGRDVINMRGSEAAPDFMEQEIRLLAEGKQGISNINVIKGEQLREKGLNLFYNVGKSATEEPRLVTVEYRGNPDSKEIDYAIVGKGLTYDTGGLNLKPTGYMEDMYMDKGGAVAAMGALKGAIEMQLPVNVVFAFGIAENAIDAKSYKPGDILTSLKGYTVSIGNTDAEGRLVLADTMTWVQREHKPKYMVDLATLTGAVKVALGSTTAGACLLSITSTWLHSFSIV